MVIFYTINEAHKQYSLLDTIFKYILDLQENIYKTVKTTYYEAGRHVVGFGDLSIAVFLEVQNKTYSYILYLIDYNVTILLMGFIYDIKYQFSRKSAENLFPYILT